MQSLQEIQIVAAGTSYHAGLYARELLETHADIRVSVTRASEYDFRGGRDPWHTLVIAITQSGETADTLTALRTAAKAGARTLAVTNTVGSTVTSEAQDALYIRAGPEIGVAATKTFVSQVATTTFLAIELAQIRNTITSSTASDLIANVRALPGAIQQLLDTEREIKQYAHRDAFFFIGRHPGYPVALESALKLKEISYEHAEGYAAGELKHGPLALVTPDTAVIAILTDGTRPRETLTTSRRSKPAARPSSACPRSTTPTTTVATSSTSPTSAPSAPSSQTSPSSSSPTTSPTTTTGNIDKPRNLAKSVTVE